MRNEDDLQDRACPFLDRDDPRCAQRLSLTRLNQAFAYCVGGCQACPVYQQIAAEQSQHESAHARANAQRSTLTIHGRRAGLARLRRDYATGTGTNGFNRRPSTHRSSTAQEPAFDRRLPNPPIADHENDQPRPRQRLRNLPRTRPEPAYLAIRTAGA